MLETLTPSLIAPVTVSATVIAVPSTSNLATFG